MLFNVVSTLATLVDILVALTELLPVKSKALIKYVPDWAGTLTDVAGFETWLTNIVEPDQVAPVKLELNFIW